VPNSQPFYQPDRPRVRRRLNQTEEADVGIAGNMSNILDKSSGTNVGSAKPGDKFPNEPTVTASDAPNAAKLGPLGYVASPATAWTSGQKIVVNGFDFNWSGTAWAAGAHALEDPEGQSGTQGYDPGGYTITEVQDYVGSHTGETQAILDAEKAGKNRVTLVAWLEEQLA
jgi:hypothetical protein